jgi:beta-glucosidase
MTGEDQESNQHPYKNASLPVGLRIGDLLGRMTLAEKAAQLAAPFGVVVDVHNPPPTGWGAAIASLSPLGLPPREAAARGNELQRKHIEDTRLGIPVLLGEEALLGLKVHDATTYPDAIAQAATWDPDLIQRMSHLIGIQMVRLGVRLALSPLADVARDPRWGRVEETYGEEPYLVGSMATAFVRGLQGADPEVPVIATLKHFIGYGASDGGRNTEPAHLGPNELREVHATPFEMAIREGGARGVMPSYNSIDGVPVTGSKAHLQALLREDLGFEGLVISDLEAVLQLHTKHGVAPDPVHAFAQALKAGVDLDLDNQVSSDVLIEAVNTGVLAEAELDRAVRSVLRAKFELGLFERPYVDLDQVPESFDSDDERTLARTIAEKAVVLLQNREVDGTPLLPLGNAPCKIAVIGPNAHRPMGQLGNYSYQVLDSITKRFAHAANPQARMEGSVSNGPDDAHLEVESVPLVTFLDGIRARAPHGSTVSYARGCPVASEDRSGFGEAVAAAAEADVAVVVVGDQSGINGYATVGEGMDSAFCELPGVQRDLVEAIAASGTPTIVVLSHGRPFVLGWMTETVPAIISSFFGGEEAGSALASVLFGDVNPAGRLPIAFLASSGAAPIPYWRTLEPTSYVDAPQTAVFPFGHGLSYTSFEYRDLDVRDDHVSTQGTIRVDFTVVNTGDVAGDEVAQIYGHDVIGSTVRRERVLLGFKRFHLEGGAAARVTVELPVSMLAVWNADGGWVVEPGEVRLFIGGSSSATPLRNSVMIVGTSHQLKARRALFSSISTNEIDFP